MSFLRFVSSKLECPPNGREIDGCHGSWGTLMLGMGRACRSVSPSDATRLWPQPDWTKFRIHYFYPCKREFYVYIVFAYHTFNFLPYRNNMKSKMTDHTANHHFYIILSRISLTC